MPKGWKRRMFYGGDYGPSYTRWFPRVNHSKQLAFGLDMQARGLSFIYEVRTAGYRADFVVPLGTYVAVLIEHDGPGHNAINDAIRDRQVRARYKYAFDSDAGIYGRAVIIRVKQGEEEQFFADKFKRVLAAQKRRTNYYLHHFLPV